MDVFLAGQHLFCDNSCQMKHPLHSLRHILSVFGFVVLVRSLMDPPDFQVPAQMHSTSVDSNNQVRYTLVYLEGCAFVVVKLNNLAALLLSV